MIRSAIERFFGFVLLGDGFINRLRLFVYRLGLFIFGDSQQPRRFILRYNGFCFPFEIRGLLDVTLLNSIFVKEEYSLPLDAAPKIIFDLGSNIGASVLYFHALYPKAMIYAFEPDPKNVDLLRRHTQEIESFVRIMPKAIYQEDGKELQLYRNPESHWSTSIVNKGSSYELFTVQTVTIDTVMNDAGIQTIDLLKFDIEGAEFDVFRTFTRLNRARYLIGEVHPCLFNKTIEEFLALFPIFELIKKEVEKKPIVAFKNTRLI